MGKAARAFSVRIGGDGRSRQRKRRFLAGAGGASRAGGEFGRLSEAQAPRHANEDNVVSSTSPTR